jgi:hypothetical protein
MRLFRLLISILGAVVKLLAITAIFILEILLCFIEGIFELLFTIWDSPFWADVGDVLEDLMLEHTILDIVLLVTVCGLIWWYGVFSFVARTVHDLMEAPWYGASEL